jgi:hypothetical protein
MFRTSTPGRGRGGVLCCARFISNKISLLAKKSLNIFNVKFIVLDVCDKNHTVQNLIYTCTIPLLVYIYME